MAIKIKNLIEELQNLNPEEYIVMASDTEGNSYGFLEGIYINHKIHDGSVGLAELTPELKEEGYDEEDVMDMGIPCVVFYPGGGDTELLEMVLESGTPIEEEE